MVPITAHRDPRAHKTVPTATSPLKGRTIPHDRVTGVSEPQSRRLDTLEVELLFEIIEWLDVKDALRLRLVSTDTISVLTITHHQLDLSSPC
jgi:hypothetical protein